MSSFSRVKVLERCQQILVCSLCCDVTKTTSFFSTSTPSLFLEHHMCNHASITEVDCLYCCCKLPSSQIIPHIQNHFLKIDLLKCMLCQDPLKPSLKYIFDHLHTRHNENVIICPICQREFPSLVSLKHHLQSSTLILYHCPAPQCLVKTHSKTAMLTHLKSKHGGSRCMEVHCQFLCSERIIINKSLTCTCNNTHFSELPSKVNNINKEECQLIDLPYSSRVLAKLSLGLDDRLQDDLCQKMEQYTKFKVGMEVVDHQKQFVCSTCQYRSVHSLADVRKHILGCHCSVSTSYTRLCLRASRLDTNSFTLFADRKLISFANEKLKRAENGSTWDGNCDFSGLQLLEDSEQESGSNSELHIRSNKRQSVSSGQDSNIKRARLKQKQINVAKMRSDSPVPEVGIPLERNENFDRVIQLNYSWPVLERLVLGQCPERYLPILKQKMDVYSQHRILLTRRNSKRYFLCSHCPNCSPHGMNDIRKHILGVHARLPERFKSAAMYCSRMNRDNYGLLSDEELLKKNQDMVRWRSTSDIQISDEFKMEPLAPLQQSSSPEDHSVVDNNDNDIKPHNVFLSEDNGECSSGSLTIVTEQSPSFNHFSQMSFPNLFHSIITNNNNNDLSDESSPKLEDESSGTLNITKQLKNGCSRRSLVLKSKNTNYNHQNLN